MARKQVLVQLDDATGRRPGPPRRHRRRQPERADPPRGRSLPGGRRRGGRRPALRRRLSAHARGPGRASSKASARSAPPHGRSPEVGAARRDPPGLSIPPPLGSRPVLLVTRTAAITVRTAVTVAPLTLDDPRHPVRGATRSRPRAEAALGRQLRLAADDPQGRPEPAPAGTAQARRAPRCSTARCGSRSASAPDVLSCPP